jgi:hypothetical protein
MPGKGTQRQLPLVLQLVKNGEEQRTADAHENSEGRDPRLQFPTSQPAEGVDLDLAMEWVGVFFRIFWLALFSGSFLSVWVFALKLAGF